MFANANTTPPSVFVFANIQNRVFVPTLAQKQEEIPYYFQVNKHFLKQFEDQYLRMYPYPKQGEISYMYGLFVEKEYRQGNISFEISKLVTKMSKLKKYKRAFGLAVNKYSTKATMKSGYRAVSYMNYRDLSFQGEYVYKDTDQEYSVMGIAELDKELQDQYVNLNVSKLTKIIPKL